MIGRRLACKWILHTVRFVVVEVLVAKLVDDYILGSISSWMMRGETDMESTEGGEGGREGERA